MPKGDIPFFCHFEGVDAVDGDVAAFQGSVDNLRDFGCFVLFSHVHFPCVEEAISKVFKNV